MKAWGVKKETEEVPQGFAAIFAEAFGPFANLPAQDSKSTAE